MEDLERRLADCLLWHMDTLKKQHIRIREDSYTIDYARREIRSLKKEIKKQNKKIEIQIQNLNYEKQKNQKPN